MLFRSYRSSDRTDLVRIFQSNCPKYFASHEEGEFLEFLDLDADANYLVVERDGQLIGCGGHCTRTDQHSINWAMFENLQLGPKGLLQAALALFEELENRILAEGKYYDLHISTSQWMVPLFRRLGFEVLEVIPNGFGPQLDKIKMKKPMQKPQ